MTAPGGAAASGWGGVWASVALRAVASAVVLAAGFRALSDDDYARAVIAEEFAAAPRLDPSGTSWLPLPFWLHGGAAWAFGASAATVRVAGIATGLLAAALLHAAARLGGASRAGALLGALFAAASPLLARLAVTPQPELLGAGLALVGAATVEARGRARVLGGLAAGAACLCRYELWPAALVRAALDLRAAARGERRAALAALAAVGPAAAWMAHGALHHGDPVFFTGRVAAYRRALGVSEAPLDALLAMGRALLAEPELLLAGGGLCLLGLRGSGAATRARVAPVVVVGAVPVGVLAGRLLDGAPTHHPERALVPVFAALALAAGEALAALARAGAARRALIALAPAVALALGIRSLAPADGFAPRDDERAIGEAARAAVPRGERVAVWTTDLGYLAVQAEIGRPGEVFALLAHDPRRPEEPPPPGARALAARLEAEGARHLVVARALLPEGGLPGRVTAARGAFLLLAVPPPPG